MRATEVASKIGAVCSPFSPLKGGRREKGALALRWASPWSFSPLASWRSDSCPTRDPLDTPSLDTMLASCRALQANFERVASETPSTRFPRSSVNSASSRSFLPTQACKSHSKHNLGRSFQQNTRYLTTSSSGSAKQGEGNLINLYREKVKSGKLRHDKCQENTIHRLDPLSSAVSAYEKEYLANGFPAKLSMPQSSQESQSSGGVWSYLQDRFSSLKKEEEVERPDAPQGFYMYGDVGSGKTMLMDLFLEATPLQYKQRVHFNSFMIDFHSSLHKWRNSPAAKGVAQSAAIESIADSILAKSPLLCFDEFQVTNIADAMILNRLFHTLWYKGAVVIATSNRIPEDLYKGGLQRENFVPFIHEINKRCVIHDIGSSTDYRLMGERTTNIWNVKSENPKAIQEVWNTLTENRPGEESELLLDTRKIRVPKAMKGIAQFSFNDLCTKPLGAADYGLLAREYHTLLLTDIPILTLDQRDYVRRFITLIDELYEHRVKLICSAEANLKEIFPYSINASMRNSKTLMAGEEEIFAFSRTLSRLSEMQTAEYLQSKHLKDPSVRSNL